MDVDNLMAAPGPAIYYDERMRRVFEDHMSYFRTHPNTQEITVDPMVAYQYEFDFNGLLAHYGFPNHLHFIIMRANNIISPNDFSIDIASLLIPDKDTISHIVQSHTTTSSIQ